MDPSKILKLINKNKWNKIFESIKKHIINGDEQVTEYNKLIHVLAFNNQTNILKYFLKNHPDILKIINSDGNNAYHILAIGGYINTLMDIIPDDSIFELVNNNDDTIYTILYHNYDFINWICHKFNHLKFNNVNRNGLTLLLKNIEHSQKTNDDSYKIIKLLIENGIDVNYPSDMPPLNFAMLIEKQHIIDLLLDNKTDVNRKDDMFMTPLAYAVKNNMTDVVKKLIDKKADLNYVGINGDLNYLILAIKKNNDELVDLFIDNGFDLHKYNKNMETPVFVALKNNKLKPSTIMKLLYYSDLNNKNLQGDTPLHLLVRNNMWKHYNTVMQKKGLDIFAVDKNNKTPMAYVKETDINDFIQMIVYSYAEYMDDDDKRVNYRVNNRVNNKVDSKVDNGVDSKVDSKVNNRVNSKVNNRVNDKVNDKMIKKIYGDRKHCYQDYKSEKCIQILKNYIFTNKNSIPDKNDVEYLKKEFKIVYSDQDKRNVDNKITGKFNSDTLHNMIYLMQLLKKYKNVGIPFQCYIHDKYVNDKMAQTMNDLYRNDQENIIMDLVKIYTDYFYEILPYVIIWKSNDQYFIHKDLKYYIKRCLMADDIRFIVLKLTIIISGSGTHANIILFDKQTGILERFEPYGIIPYSGDGDLDKFIYNKLKDMLDVKTYLSPVDIYNNIGLQTISNDNNIMVKKLGDPIGYCLAWTFWYLELRVNNPDIHPNVLMKDAVKDIVGGGNGDKNEDRLRLFIDYIRNYSNKLDDMKNDFLDQVGINQKDHYNLIFSSDNQERIVKHLVECLDGIVGERY